MPSGSALAPSQSDPAISSLASRKVSPSRSETDGATTAIRRKPRRRTRSEDVAVGAGKPEPIVIDDITTDSEAEIYEDLEIDYTAMSMTAGGDSSSAGTEDFKKPEVVAAAEKPKKRIRDNSVTRRKPRTRSARSFDSDDFSD